MKQIYIVCCSRMVRTVRHGKCYPTCESDASLYKLCGNTASHCTCMTASEVMGLGTVTELLATVTSACIINDWYRRLSVYIQSVVYNPNWACKVVPRRHFSYTQ